MTKLSGDWHSYYRYPSSGRGDDFWGQHILHATQTGDTSLVLKTGPESQSQVIMELELRPDEDLAVGTWQEHTDPNGYYKGVLYEGTIELKLAENGKRMNGVWHGAGKDGKMNSDIWELAKVNTEDISDDLPKRWRLTHWFPDANDEKEVSGVHEMKSYWHDDTLVLESFPKDNGSYMLARLHLQDGVATGNWYESASPTGPSKGAQYSGAGQLLVDPKTYRMEGMWSGAGFNHKLKKMQIYTGRWEIVPIDKA
jgi:hypothetical protein